MRKRSRIGAALGAGLYLTALGLAGYHQGAEGHGYCAEHGTLAHVSATRSAHERPAVPPDSIATAQGRHAEHGCLAVAWLAQSVVAAQRPAAQHGVATTSRPAPSHARGGSGSNIALLRLSPKASPPPV